MSLADDLADWTDWDGAAYDLGRAIGLFQGTDWLRARHVFWTDNELGNGLHDALLALVHAGVLDRRDEPDEQFRWSARQPPTATISI
jgi:hypothetical protein